MNELIAKTQSEYKNVLSQADSIEDFNKRFVIDGVPFKLIEKEEMEILMSVPGIGELGAATLIAEIGNS